MTSSPPLDPARSLDDAYPRPQLQRAAWQSLNGQWQFSKNRDTSARLPADVQWDSTITVPFTPETEASGIADTGFYHTVWYRRTWQQAELSPGHRVLLHFEAVDWKATVWVNGRQVCSHKGGYTPFHADITDALIPGELQEVVVSAEDDPSDLAKPRGKQDWKLQPHSIWYPRSTGIWQTVWLEVVPPVRIHSLHWSSNLERWEVGIEAVVLCDKCDAIPSAAKVDPDQLQLHVRLTARDQVLADDAYAVIAGEVHRRIELSDPGIDDYRNDLLWSPASPTLIDAVVELRTRAGAVLDRVQSYAALRSVDTQGDRFILNGRPLSLHLVLDQGYWTASGLTAPSDQALVRDILLVKALGFNGVRKHQKIESARFLYWADHLGLLVWEEMPSAYRYTTKAVERLAHEWLEVLDRDKSHPCIVAWVPFNESWGVPDLPLAPAQRHYVRSLYELTKAIDPSRPVIGNDGWESDATDIIGIHDYDDRPSRIAARYGLEHVESELFRRERPAGRILQLDPQAKSSMRPIVLTEFGGIALARELPAPSEPGAPADEPAYQQPARTVRTADQVMNPGAATASTKPEDVWGYSVGSTSEDLLSRYIALLEVVRSLPALAGFCYTQFTDTYQEGNGLLYADRTPKAPLSELARATNGGLPSGYKAETEAIWREQMMKL